MQWTTRERPKIDRIACPRLNRKFIDPHAQNCRDDHALLAHGMVVYEALYARCTRCQEEAHRGPPQG